MADESKRNRKPIAYLHVLGERGGARRSAHVVCPTLGSVPLARCAHCARYIETAPDAEGESEAVLCRDGAADEPLSELLSIRRPSVVALMSRDVVCVRRDLTLDALGALFLETELSALPVVDDDDVVLGFVERAQVAATARAEGHAVPRPLTVDDVLMSYAVAVPETTSVTQAAAVMAFEQQPRLAVTSTDGAVVGVLSAIDILTWLARADGHIIPASRACHAD